MKKNKKEILREKLFMEVCKIPKGKTKTYKDIAIKLKTSPRAVARILSSNQNPINIPCHRIVMSNGDIGGYTFRGKSNKKMKVKLLKKEGVKIEKGKILHFRDI